VGDENTRMGKKLGRLALGFVSDPLYLCDSKRPRVLVM